MSVYFVLQVSWTSEDAVRSYVQGLSDMIEKHGGRFLISTRDPPAVEGEWKRGRLVVIEFPTREALSGWYDSEEYRPLREFRLRNSRSDAVIVEGV